MMRRLRQLSRMLTIQRVLVKHGLDEIVWRTHLFRPLAWLGRLLSLGRRREPLGVRLRKALVLVVPARITAHDPPRRVLLIVASPCVSIAPVGNAAGREHREREEREICHHSYF